MVIGLPSWGGVTRCLVNGVAAFCCLWVSACSADDKVPVGYMFVNHTNNGIVYMTVNGQGGVLVAAPLGESGTACCAVVPKKWRPDLRVTIGWQEDSNVKKDEKGRDVVHDGVPVRIEGAKHSRTVSIPEYKESDLGDLVAHVMPGNEVVVKISMQGPSHPDYRPRNPTQRPRQ